MDSDDVSDWLEGVCGVIPKGEGDTPLGEFPLLPLDAVSVEGFDNAILIS
jgi:hypothetical protein